MVPPLIGVVCPAAAAVYAVRAGALMAPFAAIHQTAPAATLLSRARHRRTASVVAHLPILMTGSCA